MSDDHPQNGEWFPADRDLPPGRHLLHRENLMTQILNQPPGSSEPPGDRRPSPRRSPAWHPSARGLAAIAAAVALVAGLGVTAADRLSAHPVHPAPSSPAGTATAVLDRIAQAAAAGPAVKVRPDQYFYVKAQVTGTSTFARSGEVEGWIAQSQSKESLWRDNGHTEALQAGTVASAGFGGPIIGLTMSAPPDMLSRDKLLYPSYAYLQSLPANPRQLLNLIQRQITPVGTDDVEAFLAIGQLLSTTVLPSRTAAALYRAAALIPGVRVVPGATDALGRPGIGIAYTYVGVRDGFRLSEEWIFSTSTFQFLGARTSTTSTSAANREVTQATASAVLARGTADNLGGTPTPIR